MTSSSPVIVAGCTCEGPGFLHPCENCGTHSNWAGRPDLTKRIVRFRCPSCSVTVSRPIEDGLFDDDIVRIDLDDGTQVYGGVVRIEDQRVLVAPFDPKGPWTWFERWQVIVY